MRCDRLRRSADDQQLALLAVERLANVAERVLERLPRLDGLLQDADRPQRRRARRVLLGRDHVDGDVAGREVALEALEHAPAVDDGQPDVERDRVDGWTLAWASASASAPVATTALKPFSCARSTRNRAKFSSFSTISRTRSRRTRLARSSGDLDRLERRRHGVDGVDVAT